MRNWAQMDRGGAAAIRGGVEVVFGDDFETPDLEWLASPSEQVLGLFDGGTITRGMEVARERKVVKVAVQQHGTFVQALVQSSSAPGAAPSMYRTTWIRGGHSASCHCDCYVGKDCKHAVALLLTMKVYLDDQKNPHGGTDGVWSAMAKKARLEAYSRQAAASQDEPFPMGLLIYPLGDGWNLTPIKRTKTGKWSKTPTWRTVLGSANKPPIIPAHLGVHNALVRFVSSYQGILHDPWHIADPHLGKLDGYLWNAIIQLVQQGISLNIDVGSGIHPVRLARGTVTPELVITASDEGGLTLRYGSLDLMRPGATQHPFGDPTTVILVVGDKAATLHRAERGAPRSVVGEVVDRGEVVVPPAAVEEFIAEALPALQAVIPVSSPDGAVDATTLGDPFLAVTVEHKDDGSAQVQAQMVYEFGDDAIAAGALPPSLAEGRDLLAEAQLAVGVSPDAAEKLGVTPKALDTGPVTKTLRDDEYLWLMSEGLTELGPDTLITHEGIIPTFREAGEDLQLMVDVDDPEQRERTDWFELALTMKFGDQRIALPDVVEGLAKGRASLMIGGGVYVDLTRPEFDKLRTLIEEAKQFQPARSDTIAVSAHQLDWWQELLEVVDVESQSAVWRQHLNDYEHPVVPAVPDWFAATLRPYQAEGVQWLGGLWAAGLGGILADDMGLGKTVQVLAAIAARHEAGSLAGPVLVVAPTSMTHTWKAEAERFAPHLTVAVVGATAVKRDQSIAHIAAGADVVVTSYALLRLGAAEYAQTRWTAVIMDEAQMAKNSQTALFAALLKLPADVKFALSGTPLENSLRDIWSLATLTCPGLLPKSPVFRQHYEKPIIRGTAPGRLETLQSRLRPFFLRRTKDVVADDLPPKTVQMLSVTLDPAHQHVYDRALQRERQNILGLMEDESGRKRVDVLAGLTRLRRLCLDAAITREDTGGTRIPSAKVDLIGARLEELAAEGHKALVFSQYTDFLDVIEHEVRSRELGFTRLDGSTRKRDEAIAAFDDDDTHVFLISLKAGGFGLTLTQADYVFIADPWWNPAAEMQAIDRTHRIGQDKPVTVYRLIARGTIEERVVTLQQRKQDLFDSVVGGAADVPVAIDDDDIRELLQHSMV